MSANTIHVLPSNSQLQFRHAEYNPVPSTGWNSDFRIAHGRVLIVEYRDELFIELKSLFEKLGCQVARASRSDVVSAEARVFSPDLILLCGQMPEESGWLIACKLRLGHLTQPIWLYTDQAQQHFAAWQEWSGIDQVLFYDGEVELLRRLLPA